MKGIISKGIDLALLIVAVDCEQLVFSHQMPPPVRVQFAKPVTKRTGKSGARRTPRGEVRPLTNVRGIIRGIGCEPTGPYDPTGNCVWQLLPADEATAE